MPARLGGKAAAAFGRHAQPGRSTGLRRELQPPPLPQIERLADLDHHQRQRPVAQGLLGDGQKIGRIIGGGAKQCRGVEEPAQPGGVDRGGLPTLLHP